MKLYYFLASLSMMFTIVDAKFGLGQSTKPKQTTVDATDSPLVQVRLDFTWKDMPDADFIQLFKDKLFLDKYTLKRVLGTGCCGKVVEGEDNSSKKVVAIKFELINRNGPTLL